MRFFRLFLSLLLVSVMFVACDNKGGKKKESKDMRPQMSLQKRDTTEVLKLTTHFLEYLKAEKIDSAMMMLYYLDKDKSIIPLPDTLAQVQRVIFKRFPVLSYNIDAVTFMTETDSQVKYTIEFFEKQPGDNRPNTTSFFIKPMRYKGEWYLTMFDSNSFTGGQSRIKN